MEVTTMLRTVGARELKTRLGTYLRQVMAGASLLVTERGRPVAELRPVTGRPGDDRANLTAMVGAGVLSGGEGELAPFTPVAADAGGLADEVLRGREDRL
jgi:prevent-host-death family protein